MVDQVPTIPGTEAVQPDWLVRQDELLAEFSHINDTLVRPLEQELWGEDAVVTPDGRMVIGADEYATVEQAVATLGHGNFVFKIGEIALATVRGRIRECDDSWTRDLTDE